MLQPLERVQAQALPLVLVQVLGQERQQPQRVQAPVQLLHQSPEPWQALVPAQLGRQPRSQEEWNSCNQ
ncbi:MAG: hypothetical protein PW789_00650 [Edaphobacter sp.]|uniref:hypothetical protein n=1 Tax=Edaphobacter sp. TaxID=1934404 RepID=UPI00238B9375|nr:hypothetical protein [Edaphobacter sp.]MDE1175099.1 hypothetical protein [Edaphobacter sp.]